MKRLFAFSALVLMLASFASAEIIVTQQPNSVYNYGDLVSVPILVKTVSGVSGTLEMDIICSGQTTNFYKNGIKLLPGEQKAIDAGVVLDSKNTVGILPSCAIKVSLGNEYSQTGDFTVSNAINIAILTNQTQFIPQNSAQIQGMATKANGQPVDGFADIVFANKNSSENFTYSNTINNGFFSVTFVLPKDTPAGNYAIQIHSYEKDSSNAVINEGNSEEIISVEQVPTSLEIVFDNSTVEPGTSMKAKAILHDQTGNKIDSSAVISVKDPLGKLKMQEEKPTDVFLEMPMNQSEPPATWKVLAVSGILTTESTFEIPEKQAADFKIVNNTLIVANTGNIPYNKSLLVKIGNGAVELPVSLSVGETRKYSLNAPRGDYDVQVIDDGKTRVSESVSLTGNAISVKEAAGNFSLTEYPLAWIFVLLVLGMMFGLVLRKGFKKNYRGYIPRNEAGGSGRPLLKELNILKSRFTLKSKSKAELSLSLRGEKQASSVVAIKVKNHESMKNPESEKVLQNAIDFAESEKAIVYISDGCSNIFFILAPMMTKANKNEKAAVSIAKHAEDILARYNKLAKEKIDFGISLNCGDIVIKKEGSLFKFMSFGGLMNNSKKIASASNGEILASEEIKNKLISDMTLDRKEKNGMSVYAIRESRFKTDDTKKFIDDFKRRNRD